jgi:hypothetical protein
MMASTCRPVRVANQTEELHGNDIIRSRLPGTACKASGLHGIAALTEHAEKAEHCVDHRLAEFDRDEDLRIVAFDQQRHILASLVEQAA